MFIIFVNVKTNHIETETQMHFVSLAMVKNIIILAKVMQSCA